MNYAKGLVRMYPCINLKSDIEKLFKAMELLEQAENLVSETLINPLAIFEEFEKLKDRVAEIAKEKLFDAYQQNCIEVSS